MQRSAVEWIIFRPDSMEIARWYGDLEKKAAERRSLSGS
jgi:hypothetical protein